MDIWLRQQKKNFITSGEGSVAQQRRSKEPRSTCGRAENRFSEGVDQ
jgi:hypothetical protein